LQQIGQLETLWEATVETDTPADAEFHEHTFLGE
jgi:hypothetical protein